MPDARTERLGAILEKMKRKGWRGCLAYCAPSNFGKIRQRLSSFVRLTSCQFCARRWDRKHGVETWRSVGKGELEGDPDALGFAVFYAPCAPTSFYRMVAHIGVQPEEYEVVDYGSGKGKVLFLAADFPFKKIIGVEFDPRLHAQAKHNLETYKGKMRCEAIELLNLDAQKYVHPDGSSLLFFYSPFHTGLLEKVLEQIRLSVAENPRQTIICFYDDVVWNSQIPKVRKILSGWEGWRTEEIFQIPRQMDMFHNGEAVICRWTPPANEEMDV